MRGAQKRGPRKSAARAGRHAQHGARAHVANSGGRSNAPLGHGVQLAFAVQRCGQSWKVPSGHGVQTLFETA